MYSIDVFTYVVLQVADLILDVISNTLLILFKLGAELVKLNEFLTQDFQAGDRSVRLVFVLAHFNQIHSNDFNLARQLLH